MKSKKEKSYPKPEVKKWIASDRNGGVVIPQSQSRQHIIDGLDSDIKSDVILERFMKLSGMPNKVLAEKVLEISPKTLLSYRNSPKDLPVRIKEHILKLEDLFKKGLELFETPEKFNRWLKSESFGLGYSVPLNMIKSITGIDLVMEELIRIEFGATA